MPKYKALNIPLETITSLVEQNTPISKNTADLEKRVREKIHNITALYLGDADYPKANEEFRLVKDDPRALEAFALRNLNFHASTKERVQDLHLLYEKLFSYIGRPNSIADLACGLHPLGIPFMGLQKNTRYCAYDLHQARVLFLHSFITELGYGGGCFHRDILTTPPKEEFDVAFFFKEAHRFEKRQAGSTVLLLSSIDASKKIVSLPLQSLGTSSDLSPVYEKILRQYAADHGCSFSSFTYGNEVFYIISNP